MSLYAGIFKKSMVNLMFFSLEFFFFKLLGTVVQSQLMLHHSPIMKNECGIWMGIKQGKQVGRYQCNDECINSEKMLV